jgi:hypothetical protein
MFPFHLGGHYIDRDKQALSVMVPVTFGCTIYDRGDGLSTALRLTNHLQLERKSEEHPYIKAAADVGLAHRFPFRGGARPVLSACFSLGLGVAWVEDPRSLSGTMGSLFISSLGLVVGRPNAPEHLTLSAGFYFLDGDHQFEVPAGSSWAYVTRFGTRPYCSIALDVRL